jgi:outer membrane biosynthesis protein TonB
VLFTEGAAAQQGDPSSAYAGCVKYSTENSTPSLISVRLGEQATTLIQVNIDAGRNVTRCTVVKGSGSESLDGASCDWVKGHWRSLESCQSQRPQQF